MSQVFVLAVKNGLLHGEFQISFWSFESGVCTYKANTWEQSTQNNRFMIGFNFYVWNSLHNIMKYIVKSGIYIALIWATVIQHPTF